MAKKTVATLQTGSKKFNPILKKYTIHKEIK